MNDGLVVVHVSRGRRNRGTSNGGGFATGAMMASRVSVQRCVRKNEGLDSVCCAEYRERKLGVG